MVGWLGFGFGDSFGYSGSCSIDWAGFELKRNQSSSAFQELGSKAWVITTLLLLRPNFYFWISLTLGYEAVGVERTEKMP